MKFPKSNPGESGTRFLVLRAVFQFNRDPNTTNHIRMTRIVRIKLCRLATIALVLTFLILGIGSSFVDSDAIRGLGSLLAPVARAQTTFQGPTTVPGVGAGFIGYDSSRNLSIGTQYTNPFTKLFILASSTDFGGFVMRVEQPGNGPLFIIRNDGTVGIGTPIYGSTNYGNKLQVNGSSSFSGNLTVSSGTISGALTGTLSAGNISSGAMGQNTGGGNYSFPGKLSVGTSTPSTVADSLYVTGSVGIGTVTPNYKLDVNGSINISGADGNYLRWQAGDAEIGETGYNLTFKTWTGSALTEKMRIQGDGKVGIATSSPYSTLDVNGTLGVRGIAYFVGGQIQGMAALPGSAAPLNLNPLGGKVGIGMASPSSTLDVNGSINASTTGGICLGYSCITAWSQVGGAWTTTSTGVFYNGGNVGIGTTVPSAKLEVSGASSDQLFVTETSSGRQIRLSATAGNQEIKTTAGNLNLKPVTGLVTVYGPSVNGVVQILNSSTVATVTLNSNGDSSFTGGNLAIGTNAPTRRLTVASSSGVSVDVTGGRIENVDVPINIKDAANKSYVDSAIASVTSTYAGGQYWAASSTSIYNTNTGNVGIGVTSPSTKLEIGGIASPSIKLTSLSDANFYTSLENNYDATQCTVLKGRSGDKIINYACGTAAQSLGLYTVGSVRLTIDKTGQVGIGNVAPSSTLHVTGGIRATTASQFDNTVVVGTPTDPSHATTKSYVDSAIASVTSTISGSANYIPKFATANSLGNSVISQQTTGGTGVTVGSYFSMGYSGSNYGSIGYGISYTATSSVFKYLNTDYASKLEFSSGGFQFDTAPTGTAGNPITFTRAMTITQGGNVGVGVTPSYKLDVSGTVNASALRIRATGGAYIGDTASKIWVGGSSGTNYIESGNDAFDTSALLYFTGYNGTAGTFAFNGNVGIGTTNPGYKLTIVTSTVAIDAQTGRIQNLGAPVNATDASTKSYVDSAIATVTSTLGLITNAFVQNGNSFGGLATLGTNDAYPLGLEVGGSTRITIATSGYVGVGTAPSYPLQVNGKIYSNTEIQGGSAVIKSGTTKAIFGSNSVSVPINLSLNADDARNDLVVATSGYIGVGTASPGAKLDVYSTGDTTLAISADIQSGGSNYGNLAFKRSDTGVTSAKISSISEISAAYSRLGFYTTGATGLQERVRIDSGGNVSIGNASPSSTLHVSGTGQFTNTVVVGTPTTATHATTKSYVDTAISGIATSTFVKYSDAIMNTNPFGGKQLFVNSINDAMFRAESRWVVTGNYYNASDDSLVGAISAASISYLFDGSYESFLVIPAGQYAIVNVNFSTESGGTYPGYPYGYFYLSHYHVYYSSSSTISTVSTYSNYAPHGIGWHTYNFSTFYDNGSSALIKRARNDVYQISQAEFKVYAPSGGAAYISEVDWQLDRPGTNDMPLVDKYKTNYLYSPLGLKNGSAVTNIYFNPTGVSYFNGGNLGVGTTTPNAAKLVFGGSPTIAIDANSGRIQNLGSPVNPLDATTKSYVDSAIATVTSTYAGGQYWAASSTHVYNTNSGNVGIGNSDPKDKLQVLSGWKTISIGGDGGQSYVCTNCYGTGSNTFLVSDGAYHGVKWETQISASDGSTYHKFDFVDRTSGAETTAMVIRKDGNVGIGTTGPANTLQIGSVGSTGYSGNQLAVGDGTRAMALYVNSTAGYIYSSGDMALAPGTGERVRITAGGNVGIGNSSPTAARLVLTTSTIAIDVQTGRIQNLGTPVNSADAVTKSYADGLVTGTQYYLPKYTTPTGIINSQIYDNGTNVGIGMTPSYKLDVSGSFRATSGYINSRSIDTISTGSLTVIASTAYSGWYRIARSSIAAGSSGLRGGVKATVSGTGNYLAPTQDVIYAFKNWSTGSLISKIENHIGSTFFTKYRIAMDSDYAYLEGYLPSLNIGGNSTFFVTIENQGFNLDNWTAYNENLTAGVAAPLSSDELAVIANGVSVSGLHSEGNVGIATTTPAFKLSIAGGDIYLQDATQANDKFVATVGYVKTAVSSTITGSGLWTASSTSIYNSNAGNVGIGTTAPTAKLSVNGTMSDTPGVQMFSIGPLSGSVPYFGFRIDNSGQNDLYLEKTNGGVTANAMTIQRVSGNVGIGTTTPTAARLTVAGTMQVDSGGGQMQIDSGGNVIIGL